MKITATTIDEYILQYPPEVQALDGAYIEFPCDVKTEFGKGRIEHGQRLPVDSFELCGHWLVSFL